MSLLEKDILEMDQSIENYLLKSNYQDYFQPEIKNFKNDFPSVFFKNRKIGENQNKICQIIREDLLEEFISYTKEKDLFDPNPNPFYSYIPSSIYETNPMFFQTTYLFYSSFYGSFKFFKFILENEIIQNLRKQLNLWK